MKQLVAAFFTLTAIVAGILVATSLSSSAQENGGSDDTTTTTVAPDSGPFGRFGFRFDGELPPEIGDFVDCLRGQGIELPEEGDRSFMFELPGVAGLAEALEACGLPGFEDGFAGRFPFGEGEGFPFGELPDGFPFGEGFDFAEEFDFDFDHGPFGVDRDELASCLSELGSFEDVAEVREKLDECLPVREFGDLEGFEGILGHGRRGFGLPFGHFGFEFEDSAPELESTST